MTDAVLIAETLRRVEALIAQAQTYARQGRPTSAIQKLAEAAKLTVDARELADVAGVVVPDVFPEGWSS
jgi:hypothetical protein